MKSIWLIFVALVLSANSFPPEKYVLAAEFTKAIVRGDLVSARKMMVVKPKVYDWSEGAKTLRALSNYMRQCPIKRIEGNDNLNINVLLDCPGRYEGMSIHFEGSKVREVGFGPPPALEVTPIGGPHG